MQEISRVHHRAAYLSFWLRPVPVQDGCLEALCLDQPMKELHSLDAIRKHQHAWRIANSLAALLQPSRIAGSGSLGLMHHESVNTVCL